MQHNRQRQFGMTLIELVVVLGLLAALATYALTGLDDLTDRSRVDVTTYRLDMIRQALVRDGVTTSRFVNDMGRLPIVTTHEEGLAFLELYEPVQGIRPLDTEPYTYVPELDGILFVDSEVVGLDDRYGWNGPYIESAGDRFYDGFGNRFQIKTRIDGKIGTWHESGDTDAAASATIVAVRSCGRDGLEGDDGDWADIDMEQTGFETLAQATLIVCIKTLQIDSVNQPVWGSPIIIDPANVITTAPVDAQRYRDNDLYVREPDHLFRCVGGGTLSQTGTASSSWDGLALGRKIDVTDNQGGIVSWQYLGQTDPNGLARQHRHCYMTELHAVVFEPETTGQIATIAENAWDSRTTETTGHVNTITFTDLTPGIRWLLAYGGLIRDANDDGDLNDVNDYQANTWSCGLQSVHLHPGDNFVTVYLTTPLE